MQIERTILYCTITINFLYSFSSHYLFFKTLGIFFSILKFSFLLNSIKIPRQQHLFEAQLNNDTLFPTLLGYKNPITKNLVLNE